MMIIKRERKQPTKKKKTECNNAIAHHSLSDARSPFLSPISLCFQVISPVCILDMHSVVWNTVQVTCASSAPSRFWTLITCHTLLILDNRPTHGLCFILKSLMYHSIGFSSGTVILKPHLLTGHVITFKNLHHARKVILSTSVNTKLHSLLRLLNFQLLKLKQSLTQSTYIYHRSNKKRMSVHLFIF